MAIVWVREDFEGRKASINFDVVRRYTRVFKVLTDNRRDDGGTVGIADGIPRLYTPYLAPNGTFDFGATVREVNPEPSPDTPFLWIVTVEYSSETSGGKGGEKRTRPDPSGQGQQPEKNPLLRPPEVSWSGQKYRKPMPADIGGTPIVNPAGDPYDPPVEADDTRLTLTISRNEAAYNAAYFADFFDAMNEDDFWGFGPLKWKCNLINGSLQFEENTYYWRVTYEFGLRLETWDEQVVARGFHKKTNVAGTYTNAAILDPYGIPVSQPVLLDATGGPTTVPYIQTFRIYRRQRFSRLGLE